MHAVEYVMLLDTLTASYFLGLIDIWKKLTERADVKVKLKLTE